MQDGPIFQFKTKISFQVSPEVLHPLSLNTQVTLSFLEEPKTIVSSWMFNTYNWPHTSSKRKTLIRVGSRRTRTYLCKGCQELTCFTKTNSVKRPTSLWELSEIIYTLLMESLDIFMFTVSRISSGTRANWRILESPSDKDENDLSV